MSKLFDNSDSESDDDALKTDNSYASNYDNWRQKEELNKLKTKYGEGALRLDEDENGDDDDDESDTSSSDGGEEEVPQELEKEFFRTLSSLKNKDPKIYDESFEFFKSAADRPSKTPRKKDGAVYVKDHERKMLLENEAGGPEEEPASEPQGATYVEEQSRLKQNLKDALGTIDADADGDWGGLFHARRKTKVEETREEDEYREWLAGRKDEITDKNTESDLRPLKEYWGDPNLAEGEKFLRDYVLKKRFRDEEDEDYVPSYEEIIHDSDGGFSEDETAIEEQEEFEHKYNYRFEEPDQEFIKRYPRSMENSVRKQDDRRRTKRAETKQRKHEEKRLKMEEIKQMRALKRKEIEEKMAKLREITGNADVCFSAEDIEDDFDPEAHDRRMGALFNDGFYEGDEGEQKPEFPELDDELEIENWDNFDAEAEGPHCEDEDFNMDCDYDPARAPKKTAEKRKRKRKSKFAEAIGEAKPVFNPEGETYEEYLDEYYKLDCEDIIGDVPCRFKYRQVVPNDFGLSVEEILLAKDKELNRWCSIKKAVQYRPQNVEKYDVVAFRKKARNEALKRKTLPSLFASDSNENERDDGEEVEAQRELRKPDENEGESNKKRKKRDEEKNTAGENLGGEGTHVRATVSKQDERKRKKKKKSDVDVPKRNENEPDKNKKETKRRLDGKKKKSGGDSVKISDARLTAYGFKPKKFKNKMKYGRKNSANV